MFQKLLQGSLICKESFQRKGSNTPFVVLCGTKFLLRVQVELMFVVYCIVNKLVVFHHSIYVPLLAYAACKNVGA